MTQTSATIIDLGAYRAARRQEAASRKERGKPQGHTLDMSLFGFYFFWPVLAWIPMGALLAPAATEEYT